MVLKTANEISSRCSSLFLASRRVMTAEEVVLSPEAESQRAIGLLVGESELSLLSIMGIMLSWSPEDLRIRVATF